MPLSEVARRYADNLFVRRREETSRWFASRVSETRVEFNRRGLLRSGPHIAALESLCIEQVERLAKARMDSLLVAYEEEGLAFDETTLGEITNETVAFCNTQRQHAVNFLTQQVQQTFGQLEPSLASSIVASAERGVGSIVATLTRELRIRCDEAKLKKLATSVKHVNKAESTPLRLGTGLRSYTFSAAAVLIGLAATFAAKQSEIAIWVCLAVTWVLATLGMWGYFRSTKRPWLLTGGCAALLLIALTLFGLWLKPKPTPVKEEGSLRSHLHILRFQPSPVASGNQAMLNVYFANDGQAPLKVKHNCIGFVAPFRPDLTGQGELEDQLFKIMRTTISEDDGAHLDTAIPVGAERWTTCFGPHLSAKDVRFLNEETYAIYFAGTLRYGDATGFRESTFCVYTHSKPAVVFTCQRHNEEP